MSRVAERLEVRRRNVTALIGEMRAKGYAAWTIRAALTPLSRVLGYAVRGMIAANPVRKLERGEPPAVGLREKRILSREEIGKLLAKAPPPYRPILATAIFTGLRQGEVLGLTWQDVDFEAGLVGVRKQVDRNGRRVEPKTPQAVRDVVLMPALASILREHKAASPYSQPRDFVFASASGRLLDARNVARRGLDKAADDAGLNEHGPKLRWHDLRDCFAGLLIAQGGNVVFVSRQLGHASPDVTLRVYAHLLDRAEQADRTRTLLEEQFGTILAAGEREEQAEVVELPRHSR